MTIKAYDGLCWYEREDRVSATPALAINALVRLLREEWTARPITTIIIEA